MYVIVDYKDASDRWVRSASVGGARLWTESGVDWGDMQTRCRELKKDGTPNPLYKGARCEFPDFQDFVSWAVNQVGYGKGFELDKDLLSDERVYSPTTCLYLPKELNLFVRAESIMQQGPLPCGVTYCDNTSRNVYRARCSDGNRNVSLGCYATPEAAYEAYKRYKRGVALRLAEKYRGQIDNRAYNALLDMACQ